jgi:hypothetical protein
MWSSIIIISGKDTLSFVHGIYTYIPETNHVPKEYIFAAILSLLFMVTISLAPALALMYFYISTFRSMYIVILLLLLLFSLALQLGAGYGLLVTRGFLITRNDASQSVGLLLDE